MSEPKFVHLHLHTEYSLVDSVVRIKPLLKKIAQEMGAVAITDQSNMMAAVKAYKAALAQGVKPILGTEIWLRSEPDAIPFRLVLLAQNAVGYKHLCEIISQSYLLGQQEGRAWVSWADLQSRTEGLIALSAATDGDIGQAILGENFALAQQCLQRWMALFPGRFYVELQRLGRPTDEFHTQHAAALASQFNCPVVATNNVRFLSSEDFYAHEARVCINQGRILDDPARPKNYSSEQYLRSPAEMVALFADIPEAIENTINIAMRCNVELTLGLSVLPDFPIPEGMTENEYFCKRAEDGLSERMRQLFDESERAQQLPAYAARLKRELDVISQMGFAGYFLIVADFIQWAKDNAIPVGPGRGSGAGSLVAYALLITDIDPLPYDLLFERFLNPERVSMPDFDIDFCMDNRDRVIAYVAQKYGKEKVSQIVTHGSMAAKAVVRDCGRVLGHGYGFVDGIAKLVPFEIGMTLTKALEEAPDLKARYDNDEEVKNLLDLALSLEGLARNCGKHAGGVVIAPSGLTDFCPLYCEPDGSSVVTQFDKDDSEAVGLVKFDFLGLRTLTIIDNAVKILDKKGIKVVLEALPLDDRDTFTLLKKAVTTAVFQLESRGMKELIKRLQPDCFEDIVALVALFRPGPLQSGMVDDFINRKHGREPITYPHPDLEVVLKPTYGVILYQEQVMQIAQVLASYSLGQADLLRRAMGKKKPEEMEKQRTLFTEGAVGNGVDADVATSIFDLMEKFAGYGFNKSHSAAYALLSYQTAWLKIHHPAAFMCAVLSADMDNTDKVVGLIEECASLKLTVLPPDVSSSDWQFSVTDKDEIRYGLGAIKGVGEAALSGLLAERREQGAYEGLHELVRRIGSGRVGRRVLESLIHAGALDSMNMNRRSLCLAVPAALAAAERYHRDVASGQRDLFGEIELPQTPAEVVEDLGEYPERERLQLEKSTLGLFLTGHPIEAYLTELASLTRGRLRELCERLDPTPAEGYRRKDVETQLAGLVIGVRQRNVAGGKMGIVTLDDRSGRVDVVLNPETYAEVAELVQIDEVLVVEGDLGIDDFSGGFRIRARRVLSLSQARVERGRAVLLTVTGPLDSALFCEKLKANLITHDSDRQGLPVAISYQQEVAQAQLWLAGTHRLPADDDTLAEVATWPGCQQVRVDYQRRKRQFSAPLED